MANDHGTLPAPPYVSFRTLLNLLERMDESGIPQRIDRHYWSTFLGGGLGGQLMVALRWLGLIDAKTDEPTDMMERLVSPSSRKEALAELLRGRYGAVFEAADPARATPGHLDAAFRTNYKMNEETLRKAVAFFLQAAQFAGLPISTHISTRKRAAPGAGRRADARTLSPRQPRTPTGNSEDGSREPRRSESPQYPGDAKSIKLPHGSATLIVSMNWIEADPKEREYLLRLIDTLNQWRCELPGGDASRHEEPVEEVHP